VLQPLSRYSVVSHTKFKVLFNDMFSVSVFLSCFVASSLEQILSLAHPQDYKTFILATVKQRRETQVPTSDEQIAFIPKGNMMQRSVLQTEDCGDVSVDVHTQHGTYCYPFDNYRLPA